MEPHVALAIGVLENRQMIGVQKDHSPNSWRASSRSASRIFRPSSSTIFENSRPVNIPAAMRQSLRCSLPSRSGGARHPRVGEPGFLRSVPTWRFSPISDTRIIPGQASFRSAGFWMGNRAALSLPRSQSIGLLSILIASRFPRRPGLRELRRRVDQLLLPGPRQDGAQVLAGLVRSAAGIRTLVGDGARRPSPGTLGCPFGATPRAEGRPIAPTSGESRSIRCGSPGTTSWPASSSPPPL